jgi:membrane associated rhomboid family serine protease
MGVDVHLIGASGGLMGLIACAMLVEPFCITYETFFPVPVMIKGWMFIYADFLGFLGGERDGISHLTHLLGILSIAGVVYFLSKSDRKKLRDGLMINVIFIAMFVALNWWVNNYRRSNGG